MMMNKIKVQHVQYMPKELESGILYVADEFGAAAHLCPCGCGAKIRTPLGPTDWKLTETKNGPTLFPSVGNWQQKCQSHYWIESGEIMWSYELTPKQIAAGRKHDEECSRAYYDSLEYQHGGSLRKFWSWIKNLKG